jgi:hypothetical protein
MKLSPAMETSTNAPKCRHKTIKVSSKKGFSLCFSKWAHSGIFPLSLASNLLGGGRDKPGEGRRKRGLSLKFE